MAVATRTPRGVLVEARPPTWGSIVTERDEDLRALERKVTSSPGDKRLALRLDGMYTRRGDHKRAYKFWMGALHKRPQNKFTRALWLNAAQRGDLPAYEINTLEEETWFEGEFYVQTIRSDGIEEEEIGPFGSEYEADQWGRQWWVEQDRDEHEYDYEVIDRSSEEPEHEVDEVTNDEEATLEDVLTEAENRGVNALGGSNVSSHWRSDYSIDHHTGHETWYGMWIKYVVPLRPGRYVPLLEDDFKRIDKAIGRRVADAERVPLLDPERVR